MTTKSTATSIPTTVQLKASTTTTANSVYKGKYTHRSWPQLPTELIRHIATFYLWDLCATGYCPQVWETREYWHPRMVYTVLRDAREMERFMSICPSWGAAVEHHLFWQQAVTLIDPLDSLGHLAILRPNPATTVNSSTAAPPIIRLNSYQHFTNVSHYSCYVCRINTPFNSTGLGTAKRQISTPFLGSVPICSDHRKNKFCGLCLREAPATDNENMLVSCLENEDEDSWPNVDATCRTCRSEWLWRRVANNARDREAVGGSKWNCPDWETRQSIEGFIDLAEGSIQEVINLAQEKHWLRTNTKLADMLSQALAASRYSNREDLAGYDDSEDELSEDEEEDAELMQMTEDAGGVRELAIGDWARNRILDGHWFSPADQWYRHTVSNRPTSVRAMHPCPWNKDAMYTGAGDEEEHPQASTVRAEVPPSFQLCEQAYVAFQKQMRAILLPAMQNIVRRIVIECGADGVDPAMRAARMDMEDVAAELRDEAVWYNGMDWLERRRNVRKDEGEQRRREEGKDKEDGSDDSSASSKSDGSHTTSPVLSTTTLQTTPSPPPSDDKLDDRVQTLAPSRPITIAVAPVLDPPRLLRPIPYIPVTVSHMPSYSMEAFKIVWREACAPLYHCRCKICERAMARANATNSNPVVLSQHPVPLLSQPVAVPAPLEKPVEIILQEADGEGEEEIEDFDHEEDDGLEPEEEEEEEEEEELDSVSRFFPPSSRKRSCEELDDEDAEGEYDYEDVVESPTARGGTPPKRARYHAPPTVLNTSLYSARMKKRSSEELDADDDRNDITWTSHNKRAKISGDEFDADSPPTSIAGTGTETDELPSAGEADADEDRRRSASVPPARPPRGNSYPSRFSRRTIPVSPPVPVTQVDLDGLYVLDGEGDH